MINVHRTDRNILACDPAELQHLSNTIHTQGLVVFTDQNLTESDFCALGRKFGEPEAPGLFMNPTEHPEIYLVTGRRDSAGNKLGMFGNTELGWHSNGNSRHLIDKILVMLYCVNADHNTCTSWCNTTMPFNDLSESDRDYWRSIKIRLKFQNNVWAHLEDEDDPELAILNGHSGSIRPLVGQHPHTGSEYFYFPYDFIIKAWQGSKQIDHSQMIERLKKIIFRQRYQYHHIFQSGDLILSDQFTSLHRRTPVQDDHRLLWRLAGDFTKIHRKNNNEETP
jgi:taurine dioxygenase